jgi:hypothetical protein
MTQTLYAHMNKIKIKKNKNNNRKKNDDSKQCLKPPQHQLWPHVQNLE